MVMRRSSAWRKNNLREIKKTPGRYFAILAIIALGVGFFSGLIITKPAMVKTLDKYVTEHKMYDFRLLSTLGLTDEDVSFFNAKEGMTAEGALSIDFMAALDEGEEEIILKAHSVTESVSLLSVRQGRLPKAANECVLDARMFSDDVIGTKIKVSESNDKDTKDLFAYDEYEVVGLVNSVHYISYDRGTTGIGTGSVHAFTFIPIEGFDVEYFTEIQLWLPHDFEIYSEEYEDFISSREEIVKAALEERADLRYKSIVDEAMEKIADGQKEYDEAYEEYLKEKADAEKELEDAKKELEDAEKKIREEEEKLLDGEKKLLDGEKEYLEAVKEYEESLADFTQKEKDAYAALDAAKQELQQQRLRRSPNNGNGREIGFRVYAKIRKGLVVFQQYVVVGHVLFYQRGFQNQCLYFVIGYDIFKGLDPVHQSGGFRIMGSREILLHSVFKYAGFSDIYDFSGSVFHQINARQFRQCFQFFPYVKHLR
jgi:putative ABC transport system permease protein